MGSRRRLPFGFGGGASYLLDHGIIASVSSPSIAASSSSKRTLATTTVRVIFKEDLSNGQGYKGDIKTVKSGYARNFLIPQKKAVYATPENFDKLGILDPDKETAEERRARLLQEAKLSEDEDLKAADLLRYYLRNKRVKLYRNVVGENDETSPGMVDAKAIKQKLSKQLKIDLEKTESIHLWPEQIHSFSDLTDEDTEKVMADLGDPSTPCTTQVRKLGLYLARISLRGGYQIPLRVEVNKR